MKNERSNLAYWRNAAHLAFDPIWKDRLPALTTEFGRYARFMARREAYTWLAKHLDLPADRCHIRHFDEAMCERVIEVCEARSLRESLRCARNGKAPSR